MYYELSVMYYVFGHVIYYKMVQIVFWYKFNSNFKGLYIPMKDQLLFTSD